MKYYKVTGFIRGFWGSRVIKTVPECIEMRATQIGMTEITSIEEVAS